MANLFRLNKHKHPKIINLPYHKSVFKIKRTYVETRSVTFWTTKNVANAVASFGNLHHVNGDAYEISIDGRFDLDEVFETLKVMELMSEPRILALFKDYDPCKMLQTPAMKMMLLKASDYLDKWESHLTYGPKGLPFRDGRLYEEFFK